MEENITIKSVIDAFSQELMAPSGMWSWRTIYGWCPLQVAVGREIGYIKQSRARGMEFDDCLRLIIWADTGKWPITPRYS
jgi:hypothetical protein